MVVKVAPVAHASGKASSSEEKKPEEAGIKAHGAQMALQAIIRKEPKEQIAQQSRIEEFAMMLRDGKKPAEKRQAEMPMVSVKGYESRSEMWTIAQGNDLVLAPIVIVQNTASTAANAHQLTITLAYAISQATAQIGQMQKGWEFSRRVENTQTYMSYISGEAGNEKEE